MLKMNSLFRRLWKSLQNEPNENSFYESVVPFLHIMRLLGLFPVKKCSSGNPRFELDKPYLAFAVLGYLVLLIISGFMFLHLYIHAYLLTGDFLIELETYVSCTIMMITLDLPFTYLVEARQLGGLFCSWHSFQRHFKRATGTFIDLKVVKLYTVLHVAFFLFILTQLLKSTPSYLPDFFFYRLAYAYPYVLVMLVYIVVHVSLKAASIASSEYNLYFQKMMDRGRPEELEYYRLLWVELSNLMQESSNLYHNTNSLNNYSVIMVGLVLHVYRLLLVFPRRVMKLELKKFIFEAFLILSRHLYFLLLLYDHGDTITRQCSEPIHTRINLNRPATLINRKKSYFTRVFFYSLLLYKPVLSVHGYFKLKRSTYTAMITTMCTYLVVLIQLKSRISPEQLMKEDLNDKVTIVLNG